MPVDSSSEPSVYEVVEEERAREVVTPVNDVDLQFPDEFYKGENKLFYKQHLYKQNYGEFLKLII